MDPRRARSRLVVVPAVLVLAACSPSEPSTSETTLESSTSAPSETSAGTSSGPSETETGPSTETDESETDGGTKFDLIEGDVGDTGGDPPSCTVEDELDAVPPCSNQAPPDSFDPEVQWSWSVPPEDEPGKDAVATPLVANLTDDNDDGAIDLCDTPDIVVLGGGLSNDGGRGRAYILDGATGVVHASTEHGPRINVIPALGDIDDDGVPEILVENGGLAALEHDLSPKWTANITLSQASAISLADLDADGDVEIIAGQAVVDHLGNVLWSRNDQGESYLVPAAVAVDLDGDDDMEVVFGRTAFHHDGSVYYEVLSLAPGYPQVANFDADPEPEILVVNKQGLALLEHDGSVSYQDQNPTMVNVNVGGFGPWLRPAAVHDFDGDDAAEFAVSSLDQYGVFEADTTALWLAPVLDASGRASGTAFDFLGDGFAEAIYADETKMFVFDDQGGVLLEVDRVSPTQIEYPIVADVDNDQSAEIVVVSSAYSAHPQLEPTTVEVIRDVEDRWIPARRIWNQHTYHVTNVREDGTIPQVEPKHWQRLNTFRTQAQLEAGGVCEPVG